ncbi:MAG: EipA family protein [Sphingomonadaceae bacterium]
MHTRRHLLGMGSALLGLAMAGRPLRAGQGAEAAPQAATDNAYTFEEIVRAADGAFGKGAQGIARAIERAFEENGQPNGYVVGREGGGAFGVGIRYGKGTLHSKIEGNRRVYWQGPSLGPDIGGDASTVFILVYDLHDTEEIYRRYPAVEGRAYLVGGVSLGYHQLEGVRLVPVRLGAGWRLGANVGYLHFSKRRRVLPV